MKNKCKDSIDGQLLINVTALKSMGNSFGKSEAEGFGLTSDNVMALCEGRYNSIKDSGNVSSGGSLRRSSYAYSCVHGTDTTVELHIFLGASTWSYKVTTSSWSWTKI